MKEKKLLGGIVLCAALATVSAGNYEPEPKPQRIVVAVTGARYRQTGAFEADVKGLLEFWQAEFAKLLPAKPDLILVPECCDQPPYPSLDLKLEYYLIRGDRIRDYFRSVARENHCYVAYPHKILQPNGKHTNSFELFDRDGNSVGIYHKNYDPPDSDTGKVLFGKNEALWQTDFGPVAPIICYDLNFRELLDRVAARRPKLILFASLYHGGLMQGIWAYWCRSYFLAACPATSTAVNPLGSVVAASTNYFPRFTTVINLDYAVVHLDENIVKLEKLKAKYGRGVTITDPGFVGPVLVTSELKNISANDIIREFGIADWWDDYYRRSIECRNTPGKLIE